MKLIKKCLWYIKIKINEFSHRPLFQHCRPHATCARPFSCRPPPRLSASHKALLLQSRPWWRRRRWLLPRSVKSFQKGRHLSATSKAATAEELLNTVLGHELGFLIAMLLIWAPLDDASKGCFVFIKFLCRWTTLNSSSWVIISGALHRRPKITAA